MTDSEETVDEALLRRLREAIGPEQAANLDPDAQLEAVLRLLHEHPALPPAPTPGRKPGSRYRGNGFGGGD